MIKLTDSGPLTSAILPQKLFSCPKTGLRMDGWQEKTVVKLEGQQLKVFVAFLKKCPSFQYQTKCQI
jgi:hypothetical protein